MRLRVRTVLFCTAIFSALSFYDLARCYNLTPMRA